ncbi:hypothetical protein FT637_19410 [Bacillus cereus]|uniref:hypothetical protein n=1 Tax=Bacillus cereus TaxID=1396 RepID=UPI00187A366A|nr:hypothetical protein [Bacillus cereus]MBE7105126.1 hypothetical protein [Bacillus cereus]
MRMAFARTSSVQRTVTPHRVCRAMAEVVAFSFDDAKSQIRQQYPDVHIRAVSIMDGLKGEEKRL